MNEANRLREEYEAKLKTLQDNCPHKEAEVMPYQWAPGHYGGEVRVCRECNKIVEYINAPIANEVAVETKTNTNAYVVDSEIGIGLKDRVMDRTGNRKVREIGERKGSGVEVENGVSIISKTQDPPPPQNLTPTRIHIDNTPGKEFGESLLQNRELIERIVIQMFQNNSSFRKTITGTP